MFVRVKTMGIRLFSGHEVDGLVEVSDASTVAELLNALGLTGGPVMVAINKVICSDYNTVVCDNDFVELLPVIPGG